MSWFLRSLRVRGVVALIARVLNQGWSVFIPLGLGMCLGDACYILLTVFGLSKLAASWGAAFLAVRLLGAAYFIYLGYKMWTSKARAHWGAVASTHTEWLETLLQGFLIAISNPKVILFYVAFLPTLLDFNSINNDWRCVGLTDYHARGNERLRYRLRLVRVVYGRDLNPNQRRLN